ncbi:uncharacterized protein LOC109727219 isoform X2 [Ananas comosus]|uniref:Uncharacterized protein LOC109727219 isoform X2 n=1 Tax=Ananas comosus TaxID=4615 RepID=A0A6P5H4L5_ANACO|nr:uncharacterized protein LOC109727219 isoform X2 [Ananas comosus]XP_020112816.1 uncharacterized protein LOC109727219 isoform X2 [Ananas comosus]
MHHLFLPCCSLSVSDGYFWVGLFEFPNGNFADINLGLFGAGNGSSRNFINIQQRLRVLQSGEISNEERIMNLFSSWSALLNGPKYGEGETLMGEAQSSAVPRPPHLENCRLNVERNKRFDNYGENRSFPPWTLWRGLLGLELLKPTTSKGSEHNHLEQTAKFDGAYPPWIVGSDEDNYPLTRLVQRDLWIHQHPKYCSDPNQQFLVADWEKLSGFGMGAQFAGMSGLLAIAIKEKRILVTNYYNRADHNGCEGSFRSRWSCYFFPETSHECQTRAFELMQSAEAWENKIITTKENYTSKEIWAGRVPRVWGEPWSYLQPTTEINGTLVTHHRKMDRRWWRAQAIRYLMRFQTEYTCNLLNVARHQAFGLEAAKLVFSSLHSSSPRVGTNNSQADIERFVWSGHKPWVPRPLLSMHVRMGDKACEMKVVGFENYMELANRIRERFPNLNNIWLSTEMQQVIDKTRLYPNWNFYYTNVRREAGNISMATYEASLGRELSTNYPLVNFIMATDADFFTGALGSTWCYLIDSMRNTGGKVMAGYLSVNKDRFW